MPYQGWKLSFPHGWRHDYMLFKSTREQYVEVILHPLQWLWKCIVVLSRWGMYLFYPQLTSLCACVWTASPLFYTPLTSLCVCVWIASPLTSFSVRCAWRGSVPPPLCRQSDPRTWGRWRDECHWYRLYSLTGHYLWLGKGEHLTWVRNSALLKWRYGSNHTIVPLYNCNQLEPDELYSQY